MTRVRAGRWLCPFLLLALIAGCASRPAAAPRYIIYAHGRIIETDGRRPTDPRFGIYEYDAILDSMRQAGFEVLSEQRGPNANSDSAASRIAQQVDSLLTLGVAPEDITVIGFSKGGWIAILASSKIQNSKVGFVFMAACGPWSNDLPGLHVSGRMLSLIETSDTLGVSCAPMFARKIAGSVSQEMALSLGLGHGTFYQPRAAWLTPALTWASGDTSPDVILTGGRIFTADSAHPWAEAVAVRGDRIMAVGSNADIGSLADSGTRLIELGGRVVVPGFNDAHDHLGSAEFGVAFATGSAPTPDPSAPELLDSLRALAKRTPAGTWLHAAIGVRALDDTSLRRRALDAVAPVHPVMLMAWTGHGAILNSAALRALRITEDVPDPLGGRHDRNASGRLTGLLTEYAAWNAERRLYSALPDSALVTALRQYAHDALRLGITSVQDMHGYLDPATTAAVLPAAALPVRLRVVPFMMTDAHGRRTGEWADLPRRLTPLTTVSGVKWILDGTPVERYAMMRRPYADRPGWRGQLNFQPDTLQAILKEALATRQPLMLHTVGDSTARLVVNLMSRLAPDSVWRGLRVRLEHGDGITHDLLPRIHDLGIVVVQNPTHLALGPELLIARFGRVPADYQLLRSFRVAGVPLAIGSDGPWNPFLNIMLATIHPTNPAEALTREQAVTAYTRGSAYAEFKEQDKGTLAPGMLADLAVLSQDIFSVPPPDLPRTVSLLTMVGGKVVYDAGALQAAAGSNAVHDSGFPGVQARGAMAMGVDQYTSSHVFESLPDGGRIVLQRDSVDSAGTATIRMHLQHIARAFADGDFALPGFVHAEEVPGTAVLRARRALIRYQFDTLPRGGQVRIQASDSVAVGAIHEFLSFQREDHHAAGHSAE
ncbi:MAG TPA: amidohydrolase family protein [Gemmatimonadales bacterium]|nr:amidohydrolase family protein [Gemmatimonadales bacterium]